MSHLYQWEIGTERYTPAGTEFKLVKTNIELTNSDILVERTFILMMGRDFTRLKCQFGIMYIIYREKFEITSSMGWFKKYKL